MGKHKLPPLHLDFGRFEGICRGEENGVCGGRGSGRNEKGKKLVFLACSSNLFLFIPFLNAKQSLISSLSLSLCVYIYI